jgi:hypothetical protein
MVLEFPRKVGFFLLPNAYFIAEHDLMAFISVEYVSRVLSVLNASVNFYIYILTGRKFRKIFLKSFWWHPYKEKPSTIATSLASETRANW